MSLSLRRGLTVTATAAAVATPAASAGIIEYFDAAWRGFDTGYVPNTNRPSCMAVADLDADGDLDVVAGREHFWLPGLTILRNHGDGDGDLDIMAANYSSHDFSFFANHGDATFERQVRYGLGLDVKDLSYADFTGDGIADAAAVISTAVFGNAIRVVTGLGGPPPRTPGDVNGDGVVDFSDLLMLLSAWGPYDGECPEDVDENGLVDFDDLLLLLANWT